MKHWAGECTYRRLVSRSRPELRPIDAALVGRRCMVRASTTRAGRATRRQSGSIRLGRVRQTGRAARRGCG